jgi:bifunctional UDP-N-acetylglucosamine pyrophosphorylase/glucosamine-1-phosphate N-acetyltransferase
MTRLMVIPAAGRGSRLGLDVPKVLAPVAGRPMIEHLLSRYGPIINRFAVISSPAARDGLVRLLEGRTPGVDVVVQAEPTGMLDAILTAYDLVRQVQPDRVWVTWCDQLAVHEATLARIIDAETAPSEPALVVPTCPGPEPYIHFDRDASGRIVSVRQRREGDRMPSVGESDIGLFALSRRAYLRDLRAYADAPSQGSSTRERNFLPFIPWLAAYEGVVTVPCTDPIEAVGINTLDELAQVEAYIRQAEAHAADDHESRSDG